jgi:hypothetical protein
MDPVPHAIAPLLHGSKGGKRHVTGQRWEEPSRSAPIPIDLRARHFRGSVRIADKPGVAHLRA